MVGFIQLHRQIETWEWYKHGPTKDVFIHLLLRANWKLSRHQGVDVPPGSLVTGRKALAEQTGLSEQNVRTALTRLKSTSEITISNYPKFSIISITNWIRFQDPNQQTNQHLTTFQPPSNQQLTTSKEGNKGIREKGNKKNTPSKSPKGDGMDSKFDEFWEAYPKRSTASPKKPARQKFDRAVKNGTDPDSIIAGAKAYAAEMDKAEKAGTEFVAMPATWLNQERWEAYGNIIPLSKMPDADTFCDINSAIHWTLKVRYTKTFDRSPPSATKHGKNGNLFPAQWVSEAQKAQDDWIAKSRQEAN